jgi:ribosomal protein S26
MTNGLRYVLKKNCEKRHVRIVRIESKINRKIRVPWKQGAHFLAQIQDSWVFSSSA